MANNNDIADIIITPLTNNSVMENQKIINDNLANIKAWLLGSLATSLVSAVNNTKKLIDISDQITKLVKALDNVITLG